MIIDRINQQASINNARKLLKSYGTIRRLATVNTSHPLHEQAKRDLKCIQTVVGELEDMQASIINMGSYDGITDKLFDIIHHKGAFYYGN